MSGDLQERIKESGWKRRRKGTLCLSGEIGGHLIARTGVEGEEWGQKADREEEGKKRKLKDKKVNRERRLLMRASKAIG